MSQRQATTERAGRTIGFTDVPGGPVRIVLLAGTGLSGAFWQLAQTDDFASWASCLLLDNAGTGRTDPLPPGGWSTAAMAADAAAAMDAMGWGRAHVVGHSLGSAIAIDLALEHPDRVSSLSLHSAWPGAASAPHVTAWLRARQRTAANAVAEADAELWMSYAFFLVAPSHYAAHGNDSGALGALRALVARTGATAHVGQYDAGRHHEAGHRLAEVHARTLVTVGAHDMVTLPAYGRAVAAAIPGARCIELPDAGHLAPLEQPSAFNAAQRSFVEASERA